MEARKKSGARSKAGKGWLVCASSCFRKLFKLLIFFFRQEAESKVSAISKLENELFATPAHLKRETREISESGDRWLTGISEVALPIE